MIYVQAPLSISGAVLSASAAPSTWGCHRTQQRVRPDMGDLVDFRFVVEGNVSIGVRPSLRTTETTTTCRFDAPNRTNLRVA